MTNRLLFLTAILVFAGTQVLPAAMQLPETQPEVGTIRGTVAREGTSEPIPDVQVSVTGGGAGGRGGQAAGPRAGAAAIQLTARSDGAGRFLIRNVPPGQYTVRAEREGYFGPEAGGGSPAFVTAVATIVAGQQTPDLVFRLIPGAAISGRVLSSDGRPVVNSNVQAFRVAYQNGVPTLQAAAANATDDRGEYRLYRIPPGSYYIGVTPGQAGARGIRGGRGVDLSPSREGPVRTFYPNAVDIARSQPIVLKGGEDLSAIGINAQTALTVKVSGQVTSAISIPARTGPRGNAMLTVASLVLLPHDKNALDDPNSRNAGSTALESPVNGQFEIAGILPGSYDLYARVPNPDAVAASPALLAAGTQPPYYFGRTTFDARDQDLQGLSIVLHPAVDLKGHVTIDGSAVADGVTVRPSLESDDSSRSVPSYQGFRSGSAPGADGAFLIPFVYEGLYRFQVSILASAAPRGQRGTFNAYVEDIREGGVSVYDSGIRVGTRPPGLIEVIVKTNGGAIDGVVNDTQMQPKAGAAVVLVPGQLRRQNPALYKTAISDAMGRFAIRGIAPGAYKLFSWEAGLNSAYRNPEFLASHEQRGYAVTVSQGTTTSVQVSVISGSK